MSYRIKFNDLFARNNGMALVIVLGMLVLMLGVTLAYFSRATLQRKISASSAANMQVQGLAQTGVETVINDLLQEIEAGSEPDAINAAVSVKTPNWVTGSDNIRYAPSMAPQRVGDNGIANIVKVSRSGSLFFTNTSGYNSGNVSTQRVSDIATSQRSANGREITKERWNKPLLMSEGPSSELNAFQVPDWIYVDRAGTNPRSFTSSQLKTLATSDVTNPSYVVGRYSYVVYDVGGLLDINVMGNSLDKATDNARRGRLHQVSSGTSGIVIPKLDDIVKWRWPNSHDNKATTNGGLFDPKRTFLNVVSGEQMFLNRQDLLKFAARKDTADQEFIPKDQLRFLTTFSRDVNAPSYSPDPSRPVVAANPTPQTSLNPPLLSIRFASDTDLPRPEGIVTVKAGTPVMPRRFPLSKLELFKEATPDPVAMKYYFGLEKKANGRWEYVASVGGRIAHLAEVAALKREPNFFEVLQSVIQTGSVGKSAGNTITLDDERDSLRNVQIMQIGANIIDQWDDNDFPTVIEYPSGELANPLLLFGVENLPYLNRMALIPVHPAYDLDRIQVWMVFDVWNPHQDAAKPPQGITNFRIRATRGKARFGTSYQMEFTADFDGDNSIFLNDLTPSAYSDVTALNTGKELTFSATGNYSEPTVIGDGAPVTSNLVPGILFGEQTRPAVIPPRGGRTYAQQVEMNRIMDKIEHYTASNVPTGTTSAGERIYPAGTTFSISGTAGSTSPYWSLQGQDSTPIVSANFGVKSPNALRFRSLGPTSLELQYQTATGEWITYQQIDSLFDKGPTTEYRLTYGYAREYVRAIKDTDPVKYDGSLLLVNTHHSATSVNSLHKNFYPWRTDTIGSIRGTKHATDTAYTFAKADPRTTRLGTVSIDNDVLGLSARSESQAWTGAESTDATKDNIEKQWPVYSAGIGPIPLATSGFEYWKPGTYPLFGLITNNPDLAAGQLNGHHPVRYSDLDGITRPGDGYFGPSPTGSLLSMSGSMAPRPIILNRPFRSVGELGYVFRDTPWKTLDFASRYSGDLGLLDVFTLDESTDSNSVVAGKVNLNTRQPLVLEAILNGSAQQIGNTTGTVSSSTISPSDATTIANAIVSSSTTSVSGLNTPFAYRGDLVPRVFHKSNSPLGTSLSKNEREAAIRTLSELSTTRTWNFLIDVIAQTGRFTENSKTGADFVVKGESREWVHVAIDRLTGQIVDMRAEVVND